MVKVLYNGGVVNLREALMNAARVLMLLAVFCQVGGHWAVMQGIAWAEMIRTYSQEEGSLVAGIEKTFRGKAPCSKCHQIEEGRARESKADSVVKIEKKAEFFVVVRSIGAERSGGNPFRYALMNCLKGPVRSEAPPAPVPIGIVSPLHV